MHLQNEKIFPERHETNVLEKHDQIFSYLNLKSNNTTQHEVLDAVSIQSTKNTPWMTGNENLNHVENMF